MSPNKIELDIPEALIFSVGDVLVLWWRNAPAIAAVRVLADTLERVTKAHGAKYKMLVINSTSAKTPDSEARDAMIASNRLIANRLSAVALAIEGEGFGAAAVRAVISGMFLVLKPPYPLKTHNDVVSAARWLIDSPPASTVTADDLVARVAAERRSRSS